MNVIIMTHPKRFLEAEKLYNKLRERCDVRRVIDTANEEWHTGKRCLEYAAEANGYSIILQDDAVIGENFVDNARKAIDQCPQQGALISFYTGTYRPYKTQVQKAVDKAREQNASWLTHIKLLWGVGIAIHSDDVQPLLEYVKNSSLPYDERIGSYFAHMKRKVFYTWPSIVDHADGQSLIKKVHNYPRVAHEYSDEKLDFKRKVIAI